MTTTRFALDVQSLKPAVRVALSQVGVENVEKVIRVGPAGAEVPYLATFRTVVDLGPGQKGAHMSRFEEVVNEVIGELVVGDAEGALRAEDVARRVAVAIRERQEARRAEVHVTARYPEDRDAPVSGIPTQEIFTLHGIAAATADETRTITGVTAQGMTACPCAQEHLRESSAERLSAAGFDEQQIMAILEAVPVATHNQRGQGTVYVGRIDRPGRGPCQVDIDALDLVRLVESSMSSEIYELMKRTDEGSVVERAHRNPRFVEDCVREMVRKLAEDFGGLSDDAFFLARQQNLETIHQHDVIAERYGTLGELRAELGGTGEPAHQTSLRDWLDGGVG